MALHSQNYSHSQRGNKLRFMCERFVQKVAQAQPIVRGCAGCAGVCVCDWPGHHCGMGNMVYGKWLWGGVARGKLQQSWQTCRRCTTLATVLLGRRQSQLVYSLQAEKFSLSQRLRAQGINLCLLHMPHAACLRMPLAAVLAVNNLCVKCAA